MRLRMAMTLVQTAAVVMLDGHPFLRDSGVGHCTRQGVLQEKECHLVLCWLNAYVILKKRLPQLLSSRSCNEGYSLACFVPLACTVRGE